MKRLMLAAGALLLATANTPPTKSGAGAEPEGELSSVVAAEAPAEAAPAAAKPAQHKPHHKPRVAAPARQVAGTYPRCSATVTDRCSQGRSAAPHRAAQQDRRIQLAMRAGERG
jgi:hypothetical protein